MVSRLFKVTGGCIGDQSWDKELCLLFNQSEGTADWSYGCFLDPIKNINNSLDSTMSSSHSCCPRTSSVHSSSLVHFNGNAWIILGTFPLGIKPPYLIDPRRRVKLSLNTYWEFNYHRIYIQQLCFFSINNKDCFCTLPRFSQGAFALGNTCLPEFIAWHQRFL